MKRRSLILLISSLVLLILTSIGVFAWYINLNKTQTEEVEFDSNGLAITYTIDDGADNPKTLEVKPLVFSDIDREGEGYYFSATAIQYKFTFTNKSTANVDITISQYMTGITTTGPHVKCAISNTDLSPYIEAKVTTGANVTANTYYVISNNNYVLTTDTTFKSGTKYYTKNANSSLNSTYKESTVEDYLEAKSVTDSYTISNLAYLDDGDDNTSETSVVYVYVYGVQPTDSATNEFLGSTNEYPFKLLIHAEVHEG